MGSDLRRGGTPAQVRGTRTALGHYVNCRLEARLPSLFQGGDQSWSICSPMIAIAF